MSPTIFILGEYRFFFFSREEPRKHVHVVSPKGEVKFWLEPEVNLAKNYRFKANELNEIKKLIKEHYEEIIKAWEEHFNG